MSYIPLSTPADAEQEEDYVEDKTLAQQLAMLQLRCCHILHLEQTRRIRNVWTTPLIL
jgi:hypothetical protein